MKLRMLKIECLEFTRKTREGELRGGAFEFEVKNDRQEVGVEGDCNSSNEGHEICEIRNEVRDEHGQTDQRDTSLPKN